jgi:hypothetical protein
MNDVSSSFPKTWTAQDIADALGGVVDKLGVLAPKPGHSDIDRSLRVLISTEN